MYICLDCSRVFNRPATWTESHGETITGCPGCGGAFVPAERCQECDTWIPEDEDVLLCEDCQQDVIVRLGKLIDDNFDHVCKEWIYNWLEKTPLQNSANWKRLVRKDADE